jgi:hypothetical protein
VIPARKGKAVGVPRTLSARNTSPARFAPRPLQINKRKITDESVIFAKKNPGSRPVFHETSFHVSSSALRVEWLSGPTPMQRDGWSWRACKIILMPDLAW